MVRALLARLLGRDTGDSPSDSDSARDGAESEPAADDAAVPEGEPEDGDDDRFLWDLIPSWQYNGHYVQSGGFTRGEQERALRDIQAQAEAIERGEDVVGDVDDPAVED